MKAWKCVAALALCWSLAMHVEAQTSGPAPKADEVEGTKAKSNGADEKLGPAKPKEFEGKEVVVTPSRTETPVSETPRAISTVDEKEIERRAPSAQSAAELLKGEPGVIVQQTGRHGGAPIIRGMIGKYILPLYDGIRITDGTIFAGPNAFFNNIDRFTVDRVEIVRGPSSLLYGSDALGGTINMLPRRYHGFPDAFDVGFGIESRYRSVSNMFSERVEFMGGMDCFNFFLGGSFVDAGDSRGGGGLGRSYNTSWTEYNFDARMAFRPARGHQLEASYLRTEQRNIYRYDQPWETPKLNKWWKAHKDLYLTGSGLRKRQNKAPLTLTQLASVTYTVDAPTPFWDEVVLRAHWRSQYEKTVRGAEQAATRTEAISTASWNVYGATAQFAWTMFEVNRIVYGVDTRLDDVYSGWARNKSFDKNTGERLSNVVAAPGNPDARFVDIGAFIYDEFRPLGNLTISAGIRYTYANMTSRPTALSTPAPLSPDDFTIDADFTSFTYSGGVLWDVTDKISLLANIGTGFKSPSISDALSGGAFTFGVEVPSPDLQPEESTTYEIGVRSAFDRFSGEAMIYYTDLRNLIDSRPGTIGGSTFIDLNGDNVKQNDEQVYVKGNSGRAYIFGVDLGAKYEFLRSGTFGSFFVAGNASFTRGYDLTAEDNLRFIPPLNGDFSLNWEHFTGNKYVGRVWAELQLPWSFNKPKNRFAEDDFADLAQFPRNPGNLRGWVLLNLRGGVDISDFASVTASITNLLNSEYQSFGSRLPGDGISFDFGLRLGW
ncbi:MAG: TonB-dependent receptor [Planctomycetes bacterium]|nr:TonB-dependent receptor [Planctomycetota bacterium]